MHAEIDNNCQERSRCLMCIFLSTYCTRCIASCLSIAARQGSDQGGNAVSGINGIEGLAAGHGHPCKGSSAISLKDWVVAPCPLAHACRHSAEFLPTLWPAQPAAFMAVAITA